MEKFRYIDDVDRAYGAAGMAISLVIYDGDSLLYSINLDADDPHDIMEMSPDFFFAGNPVVSAKAAWTQIVNNFSIGVSMLIANLMCRHLVHGGHAVPDEDGAGACALEPDEVDRLFNKSYTYLWRLFSHQGVQAVAHDFASALSSRRTLSRLDVLELLQPLRML